MDWLTAKLQGRISPADLRPQDRAIYDTEVVTRNSELLDVFFVDVTPLSREDLQQPLLLVKEERPRVCKT